LSETARILGRLAPFAALTLLLACHTTRVVWTKPGADEVALESDLRACAAQSQSSSPNYVDTRQMAAVRDVQDVQRRQVSCMVGRGWRLTPQP